MAVATYNWNWQEGEDLVMSLVYKEGPEGEELPVNLSTGYILRMDIVKSDAPSQRLYTFNSDEIVDVDPSTEGNQPETPVLDEAVLSDDGTITITVPRALTLYGGAVANVWTGNDPLFLNYDIFLRNTVTGLQSKILRGVITVERSYTKWA